MLSRAEDGEVPRDVVVTKTLDLREIKSCAECGQRFGLDATFCPFDGLKLESSRVEQTVDPLLGATIDGRYEVRGLLGEGGMGVVYEVRHKMLGRSFAMKLLRRDVGRDPGLIERFIHEAKATASIKHPNIVSITDFGQLSDGTPYFIMELLLGQTLAQFIRARGPLPIDRVYPILIQIAGALGAAHEAGIVHRDLKPENVFLARRPGTDLLDGADDVRVVDFGAAKVLGASRVPKAGIVFGTPHYMSPEQASGQPVDHRADIYALGVMMYEMLTSRVPFEAETYMGVLTQHMFVQPIPPSKTRVELAGQRGGLEDITLRALEKKPEDRYQTMSSIRSDLERASSGDPRMPSSRPRAMPPARERRFSTPAAPMDGLPAGVFSSSRKAVTVAGICGGVGIVVLVTLSWPKPSAQALPAPAPQAGSPRAPAVVDPPASAPPPATALPVVIAPSSSSVVSSSASALSANASTPTVPPKGTAGAPASRAPAPSRSTSHHSTIPGELPDPWAQ